MSIHFAVDISVVTGHKFALILYAINPIGMSWGDGLECFSSSIGINVS